MLNSKRKLSHILSGVVFILILKSPYLYGVSKEEQKAIDSLNVLAVMPTSGSLSAFGEEVHLAMQLAITHLKGTEAELASHFNFNLLDNKGSPNLTKSLLTDYLNKNAVQILIGSIGETASQTIATIASENQKIFISPFVAITAMQKEVDFQPLNLVLDEAQQAYLMAGFAAQHLNSKVAAVIRPELSRKPHILGEAFSKYFKEMGLVSNQFSLPEKSQEILTLLKNLKEQQVTSILLPFSLNRAEPILKALQTMNWAVPILATENWDSLALTQLSESQKSLNIFMLEHYHLDVNTHLNKKFSSDFFTQNNRKASTIGALAYDAIILAAHAYKNAKSALPKSLSKAIVRHSPYSGLMGDYRINASRQINRPVVMTQTQRGKKTPISLLNLENEKLNVVLLGKADL
ncbi:MAG: ABC transporter substrate-binding protein [Oligoflexales bacterium]|nr:ABC transporter substrate-binding protein [Oligoflexales bacterium]